MKGQIWNYADLTRVTQMTLAYVSAKHVVLVWLRSNTNQVWVLIPVHQWFLTSTYWIIMQLCCLAQWIDHGLHTCIMSCASHGCIIWAPNPSSMNQPKTSQDSYTFYMHSRKFLSGGVWLQVPPSWCKISFPRLLKQCPWSTTICLRWVHYLLPQLNVLLAVIVLS